MKAKYYIATSEGPKGPYDTVAIVRKIRNGSLAPSAALSVGDCEPKAAQDWSELTEFFLERKDEEKASYVVQSGGFGRALANGWRFLNRHQISTIFSGFYLLVIILLAAAVHLCLPRVLHVPGYVVTFVLAHFLLSCYLLAVLRLARGQPIDSRYMLSHISPAFQPLFFSAALISLPAGIGLTLLLSGGGNLMTSGTGLVILAVPGIFILALYAFAPLLILDQGYPFWKAMETSRKTILHSGMETTGVLFALFVINFIAGLFALLPLVLTLPITMGALTEIYDEVFS